MTNNNTRIMLVGGGSGGHVFPLIAVADALLKTDPSIELMMVGDGDFVKMAASSRGIPFRTVKAAKARRYFSLLNLIDLWKIPWGLIQSLWIMFWFMPDVLFAKGGYSSVMPVIAAKLYFIPVVLHDSDAIPGSANLFMARFAKKILIAFKDVAKYFKAEKVVFVGNPVRRDIIAGSAQEARNKFGLSADRKTILVIGGSQGAKLINASMSEAAPLLTQKWQVIHQTGESQIEEVKKSLEKTISEGKDSYGMDISQYYKLLPFLNDTDLALAYALADIIICRAGASLIFEVATLGKPAIVIPLGDSANGHQMANAREIGRFGAVVIEEENLTRNILINQIEELLSPDKYQSVSNLMKQFATPDADEAIAQTILFEIGK